MPSLIFSYFCSSLTKKTPRRVSAELILKKKEQLLCIGIAVHFAVFLKTVSGDFIFSTSTSEEQFAYVPALVMRNNSEIVGRSHFMKSK